MLKQRIVTALWLFVVAGVGLFVLSGNAFTAFTAAVVLLGSWEWANLAGLSSAGKRALVAAAMALVLFFMYSSGAVLAAWPLWVAAVGWLVNLYWVISYPRRVGQWSSMAVRLLMGLWVLVSAWVGLNVLREQGAIWLLYVLLVVWSADIGAYFVGRAFGQRKLAPSVSPGKSWEGVFGGAALTALLAIGFAVGMNLGLIGGLLLLVATVVVSFASVLGDLLESMLKRYRGIKDSSNLLPGHGGVLDRIDSLTAAAPLFALFKVLGS
ncbi:phosphatidate cytidylyltransferase [Halomonas halocynthiae]|uniref:phosphatidate cytidylyltransferase n=1 Tax=Halomonas halocynthiae TaxID=176290 RepID=UPI0003FE6F72|nr:phosphatidate cytidylyltransferase [Halomonas halocynthiae]